MKKDPPHIQNNLEKEIKYGGFNLPDFKAQSKFRVIKTVWYW